MMADGITWLSRQGYYHWLATRQWSLMIMSCFARSSSYKLILQSIAICYNWFTNLIVNCFSYAELSCCNHTYRWNLVLLSLSDSKRLGPIYRTLNTLTRIMFSLNNHNTRIKHLKLRFKRKIFIKDARKRFFEIFNKLYIYFNTR